ncbi:MAG: hypothetical protein ABIH03_07120 [Pseudomonadota bacterium]
MNKTSLWIVVAVTAAWIGFMLGYSMSAHTGAKATVAGAPAVESGSVGGSANTPAAGGYGGGAKAPAAGGGYGGGAKAPAVGGYGGSKRPAAGGYGK